MNKLTPFLLVTLFIFFSCGCDKMKKSRSSPTVPSGNTAWAVGPDDKGDSLQTKKDTPVLKLPRGRSFLPHDRLNPGRVTAETTVLDLSKEISLTLVWIPSGTFMMGNNLTRDEMLSRFLRNYTFEHFEDEYPAHKVTISKGFWIGKHEITQQLWQWVMGSNPSLHRGAQHPVDSICWADAEKFCAIMNSWGIARFELPTEAQWEYAARAGSTTPFYWGLLYLPGYAWDSDRSGKKTHPVGLLKPNNWGLYDITGNVHEICRDCYDRNYYSRSPTVDPLCMNDDEYRVVRGGWYTSIDKWARIAGRGTGKFDFPWCGRGFRIIATPYTEQN